MMLEFQGRGASGSHVSISHILSFFFSLFLHIRQIVSLPGIILTLREMKRKKKPSSSDFQLCTSPFLPPSLRDHHYHHHHSFAVVKNEILLSIHSSILTPSGEMYCGGGGCTRRCLTHAYFRPCLLRSFKNIISQISS